MSELDVKGEAFFCLQPDTPVSSSLSHDPTAQGCLTQTSSCPKRGTNNHGTTASVVPTAAPRGSIKQHNYFKQLPSDPKLRTVSPT